MSDTYKPTEAVATNAKRALRWLKEGYAGSGFTDVGRARAVQLANREPVSLETVKRMNSYFARHAVDKQGKDFDNLSEPSAGRVAWDAWGGDAGQQWAKQIVNSLKEKTTMASTTASAFFGITKSEKQADGTLIVSGIATDDSLDVDQQICDPAWLEKAMPQWFQWGNIREQHSNIAAGVATEYEARGSQHIITARVVDPASVKKVEAGVLKGFSIGIRSPRVIKDNKAAGGRIVDGEIVEVSLVDRPANPTCTLTVAKSVEGALAPVEELVIKYSEDQERDERGRFGSGGGSDGGDNDSGDSSNDGSDSEGQTVDEAYEGISDIADEMGQLASTSEDEWANEAANDLGNAVSQMYNIDVANRTLEANERALERAGNHIDNAQISVNRIDDTATRNEAQNLVDQAQDYWDRASLAIESAFDVKSAKSIRKKKDNTMSKSTRKAEAEVTAEVSIPEVTETSEQTEATSEESSMAEETAEEKAVEKMCKECGKADDECKCAEGGYSETEKAAEESSQALGEESSQELGEESTREGGVAGVAGKSDDILDRLTAIEASLNLLVEKSLNAEDIAKSVDEVTERLSVVEKTAKSASAPVRMAVGNAPAETQTINKAAEYRAKAMSATDPILAKGFLALAMEIENNN